jgi:hypothetical protein
VEEDKGEWKRIKEGEEEKGGRTLMDDGGRRIVINCSGS